MRRVGRHEQRRQALVGEAHRHRRRGGGLADAALAAHEDEPLVVAAVEELGQRSSHCDRRRARATQEPVRNCGARACGSTCARAHATTLAIITGRRSSIALRASTLILAAPPAQPQPVRALCSASDGSQVCELIDEAHEHSSHKFAMLLFPSLLLASPVLQPAEIIADALPLATPREAVELGLTPPKLGTTPPSKPTTCALGGANALRCSGRGRCVAGECMCDHGYAGLSCDRLVADPAPMAGLRKEAVCPTADSRYSCSGHGRCLDGRRCACQGGYYGLACSRLDAVPCPHNCSWPLGGQCVDRDRCVCRAGRAGEGCASFTTVLADLEPTTCPTTTTRPCSGHGSCQGHACACDRGFSGPARAPRLPVRVPGQLLVGRRRRRARRRAVRVRRGAERRRLRRRDARRLRRELRRPRPVRE